MVQEVLQRSYVLPLRKVAGKIKDTGWFCVLQSLLVVVQGYDRILFFACSGNGNGTSWNNRGSNGNYWSSSFNSARNARNLNFNSGGVNTQNNNNRYNGFAVRAVQLSLLTFFLLFSTNYGANISAATTRSISGFLRCEKAQEQQMLCEVLGIESEREYGRPVQRFVQSDVQTPSIEMLHSRLPQEARNLCGNVQGPNRTPFVFQLYSWSLREDVYTRHIQLYQRKRYTLWNQSYNGFLPQGESELAGEMLRHALGYSRLLHAHCKEEALRDCHFVIEENGYAQNQQGFQGNLGSGVGYGLCDLAHGNHRHAQSQGELRHCWRQVELGWLRPCQVDATLRRWSWSADRQSDKPVILQCVPECFRPVYETRVEMQVLWEICGRCSRCLFGQRASSELSTENQGVPEIGTWIGTAHGETGGQRGTSRSRVLGFVHQALQNVYLQSLSGAHEEEDFGNGLFQAFEGSAFREQLLGYLPTYCLIPSEQEVAAKKGDNALRYIHARYDKDDRQIFIL